MARANSSSPTIGRRNSRSNTAPTSAMVSRAISTASVQVTQTGAPGIHRPGMSISDAYAATKNAPRAANAPWAKLRTWVDLKMMTNPTASKA